MIYILIIFLSLFSLVGCGGGGGGAAAGGSSNGGSISTTIPDPTWNPTINPSNIASFKTTEYNAQFGLDEIHSAEAYALLQQNNKAIAGDNIKIAISDTGVLPTHQEIVNNYDAANSTLPTDIDGHGTHVASTAAGVKNGLGMHGVAFNAKIISVNLLGDNADGTAGRAGITFAGNAGAKIVNMSWAFTERCVNGSARCVGGSRTMFAENTINDANYLFIKNHLAAEFASAVTKDVVMTVAAGNDGDSNHIAMPALFAQDAITNKQMIAVGAVDKNGDIAFYSNRCKQAKEFCLVAPGGIGFSGSGNNIFAASIVSNSSYVEEAGTSMAAPHVAGAAAVLRAAWSYLSASQTVQILLDTATDLGVAGVDDTFGHGLLNLGNAVTAQGPNNIAPLNSVASLGADARTSSIATNPIFGNAYSKNLAPILKNAVFFDKYGRDYQANLDQKININNTNFYNLSNLLFTNHSTTALPIAFGKNYSDNLAIKFATNNTFFDPQTGEIKRNKFGLKYLTIDRSKEDQNIFNSSDISFSYSKNFGQNLKIGFSKNDFSDDFSLNNPAQKFNLISYNDFTSSPYKKLSLANFTQENQSQINSNQLNISQNFTSNLTASLAYTKYNQSGTIAKFSDDESRVFETGLSYKFNDKTKLSVNFGNLKELNNNFLGSKTQGAFSGGNDPQTKYLAFNVTKNLINDWQLTTSYSQGKTYMTGNNLGVFRDFNNIESRGMAVGLLNDNFFNAKLAIVYSEPLRVYRGSTNIDIPVSRDAKGSVQRMVVSGLSLVPDGRERDLEFSYSLNLPDDATINFNSIIQQEANNIKDSPNQYLLMVRYNLKF